MKRHSAATGNSSFHLQEYIASGKKIAFFAVIFVIAYFLFQAFFITIISHGAGLDDAEQLANISFFDWGYGGSQPPLYTWILIGVTSLFGTHFIVLQLVKFALLASLFLSIYFGLRNLKVSPLIAASAMLGIFLLPQIAWESQRALSHSILGTASCGWLFWAMTHYIQRQTISSAILLGVVIAASVLGKFNDIIFLVAIFVATLSFEQGRKALFNIRTLIFFVVAALLLFKPLTWILNNIDATLERSGKFGLGYRFDFLYSRFYGIFDFVLAVSGFVGIALFVVLIINLLSRSKRQFITFNGDDKIAFNFVGRILYIALAIVFLIVIISGATQVKDRWLQPVLILTPAYFAFIIYHYIGQTRAVIAYALCGVVVALIVPIGLYVNLNGQANKELPLGLLQFDQLYTAIEKEGPIATIVSPNTKYAGNLRLFNAKMKVVHDETVDPIKRLQRPLLILDNTAADSMKDPTEYGEAFKGPLKDYIRQLIYNAGFEIKTIKVGYNGYPDRFEILRYIYIP